MVEAGQAAEEEDITIVVVDDHPVVRRGLQSSLDRIDGISVVGTAGGGEEAIAKARELKPTIVLMDYSMDGMSGVEATRQLGEVAPQVRVVMLTSFGGEEKMKAAVEAGAVGYVLKDSELRDIVDAVRKAARTARVADLTDV